jgi:hypothetical protein
MATPLKKLLSRLELPAHDWVLSRFGGREEEPAPESQTRAKLARLFGRWVAPGAVHERPESGQGTSLIRPAEDAPESGPRNTSALHK